MATKTKYTDNLKKKEKADLTQNDLDEQTETDKQVQPTQQVVQQTPSQPQEDPQNSTTPKTITTV